MARDRLKLDGKNAVLIERVREVIDGMRQYWPLTLRQVYYQLVAAGVIANEKREYKRLSRILTSARLQDAVPWSAIEDRSRSMDHNAGWRDAKQYISSSVYSFLNGYHRDLSQGQNPRLEIWVEKDALSRVVSNAAEPFNVPVVVAKGFGSVSFVNDARDRIEANFRRDIRTRILYFGDFDPSGWEMLPAMMLTLQDEMNLGNAVEDTRCALNPDQVETYDLVHNPDAFKVTDSRAQKFAEQFGEVGYELDAVSPADLTALVKKSIEDNFDLTEFYRQRSIQGEDLTLVESIREKVQEFITDEIGEV